MKSDPEIHSVLPLAISQEVRQPSMKSSQFILFLETLLLFTPIATAGAGLVILGSGKEMNEFRWTLEKPKSASITITKYHSIK